MCAVFLCALVSRPVCARTSAQHIMNFASDVLDRWQSSNRLRLNQDKTQHIWLGSRAQLSKIDFDPLRLRFPNVHISSSVRDLGFIHDPVHSLSDHVNSVSISCFYYLRQLRSIRQSLPLHAITSLVHALICARVDYCNAVDIGMFSTNASELQSVLNAVTSLIGASQSSPISLLS